MNILRPQVTQGFTVNGFLVRVFLYSSVTLSLVLLWWVRSQISPDFGLSANIPQKLVYEDNVEGKRLIKESLQTQLDHHEAHQTFIFPGQIPATEAPSAKHHRLTIWSAPPEGPFQQLQGVVFPPHHRQGVIVTVQANRPGRLNYIGAAFVSQAGQVLTTICQTQDEIVFPKMFPLTVTPDRIQCPLEARRLAE